MKPLCFDCYHFEVHKQDLGNYCDSSDGLASFRNAQPNWLKECPFFKQREWWQWVFELPVQEIKND